MPNPRPSPLCIRLTERERERLQTAATKAGRTLAGEIKWRCFKKCKEQDVEALVRDVAANLYQDSQGNIVCSWQEDSPWQLSDASRATLAAAILTRASGLGARPTS